MIALATENPDAEGLLEKALAQAARELLLAQSSDWAFIMTSGTMDEYARGRAYSHLARFFNLSRQIRDGSIDEKWLKQLQETDNLFANLDYRLYQSMESTVPRSVEMAAR